MKPGKIDWETGIVLEWDRRNGEHARTFTINTSMFRLGLTPQAEVRLQIDECITHTPEGNFGGIANAAIGTKIKVYEGGKVFPKVSFMGTILIPGGSNADYLPKHVGIQAHLLFENELSSKFTLGYTWEVNGMEIQRVLTFSLVLTSLISLLTSGASS
ncbi:MAG: hypothetical protein ACFNVZ_01105 [Prevotella melaninogenica]